MKKMACIIVAVMALLILAAVNLAAADGKIIEVFYDPWGTTFYELVIDAEGNAWLRTRLQEYVDKNHGSIYASEIEARLFLMDKFDELRKNSNEYIKDEYKITFLTSNSSVSYYNSYAITKIGNASIEQ